MKTQSTALDKAVKISIIAGALIITLSIAYYLVIFMPKKESARLEQQKQEYISKKKRECYEIYLKEKDQWNNAKDSAYSEVRDKCFVIYKSNEEAKSEEQCNKIINDLKKDITPTLREMSFDLYDDCLNNTFRKEF